MAITHVYDTPPQGAAADWTMPQKWDAFTADQHKTWDELVAQQSQALVGYACDAFLSGLDFLRLSKPGIPEFGELNERLRAATGWEVVAVPGAIPNDAFFHHLSQRRFPAANFLRAADSLDYSQEPDLFHDLFGHLPMLTNPVFAEFMLAYGRAGLRAEGLGAADFLGRLYLYTVEFGLVAENGGLRGYGAGLLSSYSETRHALTSPETRRLCFDIPRIMRTEYLFDEFQRVYFVVDSFDHLLRATEETNFSDIYRQLGGVPSLKPDERCPGDSVYESSR